MKPRVIAGAVALVMAFALVGCIRTIDGPQQQPAPSAPDTGQPSKAKPVDDPVARLEPDPSYRDSRPEPYSWATDSALIAHGMGGIGDKRVTNTYEAFKENYSRGFRVFEVDFALSEDGHLVARHDWDAYMYDFLGQATDNPYRKMGVDEFKRTKIHGSMTPLTIEDVVRIMKAYPDAWIVTDTKSKDPKEFAEALRQISAAIGPDDMLADRFIIQIYNEPMMAVVSDNGDFANLIYTLYQMEGPYEQALAFAKKQGIMVVAMPDTMLTNSLAEDARAAGRTLAVYTVNDAAKAAAMRGAGVGPIYTDFLEP